MGHTIASRQRRHDSASSVWADKADPRDRLVWTWRPLGGPAGSPIQPSAALVEARADGTVSRAGRRAISRAARKEAERLVTRDKLAAVSITGRTRVWKGRAFAKSDLSRATLRRIRKGR